MPPTRASGGETKQGLIVTLVFFILTTIGGGVAAYMGFSEQEKFKKKAEESAKTERIANDERDYYVVTLAIVRQYLGSPPSEFGVFRFLPVGVVRPAHRECSGAA